MIGVAEFSLGEATGLRGAGGSIAIVHAPEMIVAFTAIVSDVSWQTLALPNGPVRMPWPQTICFTIDQLATPSVWSARFRVRGFDQFGQYQEEVTPILGWLAIANVYVYLSTTFSVVTSVAFSSNSVPAGTNLAVGVRPDFRQVEDATNTHIAGINQGYGLPLWLHGGTARELLSLSVYDHTNDEPWEVIPDDSLVIGNNAVGWLGSKDKFSFRNLGAITFSGASTPVSYAVGDTATCGFWMLTREGGL